MSNVPRIYPAIISAMESIGAIGKNRKNPQQGYQFRGIDDVLNNLQPALLKAKVFVVPRVTATHREERSTKSGGTIIYTTVDMEFDFCSAEDGSKVTAKLIGEGMDTSDKSTNKAMSAALKYAIIQVLSIPTEELLDSERDHIEPQSETKSAPKAKPAAKPKSLKEVEAIVKAESEKYLENEQQVVDFLAWYLAQADQDAYTVELYRDLYTNMANMIGLYKEEQAADVPL